MAIGKKLKNLLQERNLRCADLSRMTGIPVSTLYNIIKRDSPKTNLNNLVRISLALHVPIEYFSDVPCNRNCRKENL